MKNLIYLSNLEVDSKARIKKMDTKGGIRRRLQDIGIIENAIIECKLTSIGNEIKGYLINGSLFAIRKEDTDKITVEYVK